MHTVQTATIAELLDRPIVSGSDFAATIKSYSENGSSIGDGTLIVAMLKRAQENFQTADYAACIEPCLTGAEKSLGGQFPGDAIGWARVALECVEQVLSPGAEDVLASIREAVSPKALDDKINLAGRLAIQFHRAAGNTATQSLEAGHLLAMLQHRLYPPGGELDTAMR